MSKAEEEKLVRKNIEAITQTVGRPKKLGWYYGRLSPNSYELVTKVHREIGLPLTYWADSYADDRPYWQPYPGGKKEEGVLVMPYSFDNNDMRFHGQNGFTAADQFYTHLKNAFDVLYAEGEAGKAGMMSIGLHCRIVGTCWHGELV